MFLLGAPLRSWYPLKHQFLMTFSCAPWPQSMSTHEKCRSCLQKRLFSTCSPCLTLIGVRGFKLIKKVAPTYDGHVPKLLHLFFIWLFKWNGLLKCFSKCFSKNFSKFFSKFFFGQKIFDWNFFLKIEKKLKLKQDNMLGTCIKIQINQICTKTSSVTC